MKPINQTDRTLIVQRDQELTQRLNLISTIAELSNAQLQAFHNAHFSSLSPEVQEGIRKLEEAVWAIAKTMKQTWPMLKEYMYMK